MQNDVKKMTDLELAQAQGQIYNQLLQDQQGLQLINNEIQQRSLCIAKTAEVKPLTSELGVVESSAPPVLR